MPAIPSTNDLLLTVVQQANDLRIATELIEELRARNVELEQAAEARSVAAAIQSDPQAKPPRSRAPRGGKS